MSFIDIVDSLIGDLGRFDFVGIFIGLLLLVVLCDNILAFLFGSVGSLFTFRNR